MSPDLVAATAAENAAALVLADRGGRHLAALAIGISIVGLRGEINRLVLNFFAPMLFFAAGAAATVDLSLLQVPLILGCATLAGLGLAALALFATPLGRGLSRPARGTIMLASGFGNVLFFGYPLLTTVFGESGARYPFFADMLAATPLVWSIGVWIAFRCGKHTEHASFLSMWLKLPPVWGFAAGLAVNLSGLPARPRWSRPRAGRAARPFR